MSLRNFLGRLRNETNSEEHCRCVWEDLLKLSLACVYPLATHPLTLPPTKKLVAFFAEK